MEGSLVAYKVFSNGSVLNASEINDNLMNQSVMVFSNAAARTAAITSPVEGMLTWLEDVDRYEAYSLGAWQIVMTLAPWVSYTPTFTNFTLGNGSLSAAFYKIGRQVTVRMRVALGSTSSMGSFPNFTLPVAASGSLSYPVNSVGLLQIEDAGTREFMGAIRLTGTLNADFLTYLISGTAVAPGLLTPTSPMTWATNDKFWLQMTYEAAA
jgi:hypothetical protein